MISKILWKLFRRDLMRYYLHEANKPVGFSDLEYAMSDLEGRKYYIFPISMTIGLERLAKLDSLMGFYSARISGEELGLLLDEADKLLTDGLKIGKNAAKIGAIHNEIRTRPQMCMHVDLLYHIAAAGLIREDEVIDLYDNDIQLQKVMQFKKEVAARNSYFFFHQTGLKSISNLHQYSEEEWQKWWTLSQEKLRAFPELIKSVSLNQ